MNKPNALNPGASSTAEVSAHADGDAPAAMPESAGIQAYENSPPGALGNVPGAYKAKKAQEITEPVSSAKTTSKTNTELLGNESGTGST